MLVSVCRRSDDEDTDNAAVRWRVGSSTTPRLRRRSVHVFGERNKTNNDNSSDDSDSIMSLHRDPLHRRNMLTWRDHWHTASANRLYNADRNNNNNNNGKCSACTEVLNARTLDCYFLVYFVPSQFVAAFLCYVNLIFYIFYLM